jgi:hypothetical protein
MWWADPHVDDCHMAHGCRHQHMVCAQRCVCACVSDSLTLLSVSDPEARSAGASSGRGSNARPARLAPGATPDCSDQKRETYRCNVRIARCALSADRCRDRRRGEFTSPRPTACWPCWVEPNQWNGRTAVLLFLLVRRVRAFGGPVTLRVRVCTRCRLAGACVCVLSAYLTMNLN